MEGVMANTGSETDAAKAATAGAPEDGAEFLDEEVPRFIPPWFAEPDEDADNDEQENYIVVSYCYSDENPVICRGSNLWPLDRETATLIAASPDLLEALQMLIADFADYPASERPCLAFDKARAAITKALGPVAVSADEVPHE